MIKNNYYQINTEEKTIEFEPFTRKTNKYPFSYNTLRNTMIISLTIGIGLLMYTATITSPVNTINLNTYTKYSLLDNDTISVLFDEFKTTYNKSYETDYEETIRYDNFRKFLYMVDERNNNDSYAIHGITKFADLTNDEFKNTFLGYKTTTYNNAKIVYTHSYDGNETYVNWADIYTTPVKDQGYCGSCWAFSATEQIESDAIRLGLLTRDDILSPEQIVQCDTVDDGCNGGNTATAFNYIISAGGIESDTQYPYTSYYDVTGDCKTTSNYEVTIDEYYLITDEVSMMSHIFTTGPISICLDASTWSSYVSGIITNCGMEVDHCVQAVGLNTDEGYWIVRNSWGTEWGNEGFIWLEAGTNMCNIAYDPKFVNAVLA
jgi:C1A family cysteine protease